MSRPGHSQVLESAGGLVLVLAIGLGALLLIPGLILAEDPSPSGDATVGQPDDAPNAGRPATSPTPRQRSMLRGTALFLVVGFLLLLVFLIATYAMIRGSRRMRKAARHKRPPPTDATDVWAMHQAPVFDEADFEFDAEDPSGNGRKASDNGDTKTGDETER